MNDEEVQFLRSQFVTLKHGRGQHRKYRPLAFTEQGVAMLSSVLRSKRTVPGHQLGGGGFLDNSLPERYFELMAKDHREWLKQAEYDLETAKFMQSGGRYPESLAVISSNYTAEIAKSIIDESQEALEWAKRQY